MLEKISQFLMSVCVVLFYLALFSPIIIFFWLILFPLKSY